MKANLFKYLPVAALVLVSVLAMNGCPDPRIELYVASQPNVNPDDSGRPSPVIIRIYELRSEMAFEQADFQSLFDKYLQVLSADLVSAKELTCVPGRPYEVTYQPMPSTRFLGIIAGFRQMERAQWRALVPVDPEGNTIVKVEANDTALLLVPESEAGKWTPEKALEEYHKLMNRVDVTNETPVPSAPGRNIDRPGGRQVRIERINP